MYWIHMITMKKFRSWHRVERLVELQEQLSMSINNRNDIPLNGFLRFLDSFTLCSLAFSTSSTLLGLRVSPFSVLVCLNCSKITLSMAPLLCSFCLFLIPVCSSMDPPAFLESTGVEKGLDFPYNIEITSLNSLKYI